MGNDLGTSAGDPLDLYQVGKELKSNGTDVSITHNPYTGMTVLEFKANGTNYYVSEINGSGSPRSQCRQILCTGGTACVQRS
jgi:hypothetical protein